MDNLPPEILEIILMYARVFQKYMREKIFLVMRCIVAYFFFVLAHKYSTPIYSQFRQCLEVAQWP